MRWYRPEYMGTIADWASIVATIATIVLTMRYYFKDNEKSFKIVFYPLYTTEKKGITYYNNEVQRYEFYAVNFSKHVDSVYFYTIKTKANIFVQRVFGVPIEHVNFGLFNLKEKPDYQVVDPKHNTTIETIESQWLLGHALHAYKKTNHRNWLKHIDLEIIYVSVEGKEFKKTIRFSVKHLLEYEKSKKVEK